MAALYAVVLAVLLLWLIITATPMGKPSTTPRDHPKAAAASHSPHPTLAELLVKVPASECSSMHGTHESGLAEDIDRAVKFWSAPQRADLDLITGLGALDNWTRSAEMSTRKKHVFVRGHLLAKVSSSAAFNSHVVHEHLHLHRLCVMGSSQLDGLLVASSRPFALPRPAGGAPLAVIVQENLRPSFMVRLREVQYAYAAALSMHGRLHPPPGTGTSTGEPRPSGPWRDGRAVLRTVGALERLAGFVASRAGYIDDLQMLVHPGGRLVVFDPRRCSRVRCSRVRCSRVRCSHSRHRRGPLHAHQFTLRALGVRV